MTTFIWPAEDGWPYPDEEGALGDPESDLDEDLLALHCLPAKAMDSLEPLERTVLAARFGMGGSPVRSMKELHVETGHTRAELRSALSSGLAKLRAQMASGS
jgi:DNA-directed RNA polymerase sigma subunit (sigma70/sigma32)